FDIQAAGAAMAGNAFAVWDPDTGPARFTVLYRVNLTTGAATPLGAVGGNPAIQGIAIVPDNTLVVASAGVVNVLDAFTGQPRLPAIPPFVGFSGALSTATADVNRDSVPDIIVGAMAPNGHVKVFDGVTGAELFSFFSFQGFN